MRRDQGLDFFGTPGPTRPGMKFEPGGGQYPALDLHVWPRMVGKDNARGLGTICGWRGHWID